MTMGVFKCGSVPPSTWRMLFQKVLRKGLSQGHGLRGKPWALFYWDLPLSINSLPLTSAPRESSSLA